MSTHELKVLPPDEAKLIDDVKKLLGKPPYNHPANFCWNDNYFAKYLNDTYGEQRVAKIIKKLNETA